VCVFFTGAGHVRLKAERSLGSVRSCVIKNKGEGGDNIYRWLVYWSWKSLHASAVSDLTKSAEFTIADDSRDHCQYEEVIY